MEKPHITRWSTHPVNVQSIYCSSVSALPNRNEVDNARIPLSNSACCFLMILLRNVEGGPASSFSLVSPDQI
jgi:hypothetical protein